MNKLRVFTRQTCQTITAIFVLAVLLVTARPAFAQEAITSESLLPANTTAWVSVPDAKAFKEAMEKTQFGAMMNDPNVQPFVDDLVNQIRSYLDEQNIRFGMKLADIEEVHSGEICLAGVLKRPAEGAEEAGGTEHGIVLLVDVSKSGDKVDALLAKVHEKLVARNATEEKITINEIETSKWSFEKPEGLRKRQYAFHGIAGGWLLATDHEKTFREIMARVTKATEGTSTLQDNEAFTKVVEGSKFKAQEIDLHVRWFVEPFGYVQLAQAIADAQESTDGKVNNIAEKFEEEGFSAIKGVGGVVSFATSEHETAHRTFIYAPPVVEGEDRYLRAAAMLDFRNTDEDQLNPPGWVPSEAAGYMTFTWDLQKALDKVGYIIDKTSGTEDSFKRALESLKTDPTGPEVDVPDLVSKLNNRITVCSVTEMPIDDESERIVFGIKIHRDEVDVEASIYRLVRNDAIVEEFEGSRLMIVDTADVDDGSGIDFEAEFDNEFGIDPNESDSEEEEAEEDELEPAKPLFEKRVFVVRNGYLLIGNNVDQIKSVIKQMPSSPGNELAQAADYVRINKSLEKLTGGDAPSFRHFGRMDKTVRTNYEMMRTGKMAESKTLLAQLINRAYTTDETDEDFVREQEFDGSTLPEDFEGEVAKYFGPTGMVIHTVDEGWMITGVILKKETDEKSTSSEAEKELAGNK